MGCSNREDSVDRVCPINKENLANKESLANKKNPADKENVVDNREYPHNKVYRVSAGSKKKKPGANPGLYFIIRRGGFYFWMLRTD